MNGLPIRSSSPWAPGRLAYAGRRLPSTAATALNCVVRVTPRPQAVSLFVASSTATACAPAAPALLLRPRDRPRPAVTGRANDLPLRSSSPWAPGRPAGAGRRLPSSVPTALNGVVRATPGHKPGLCSWPLQVRGPARRLRQRYSYSCRASRLFLFKTKSCHTVCLILTSF